MNFNYFRKLTSLMLIAAFAVSSLYIPQAQAGEMIVPLMPAPGTMVNLSSAFVPAHLKGITIHPDDALKFDFLIHKGDGQLDDAQKRQEYKKLVKYFLASLTIPDEDQWVNLSPYEKNRIIADNFGKTEMGRDLLSQDYLLKQITASLMYPESGLGKAFWDKVYERAYKEYGNMNIPVNTFNKVWIVPDEAIVYESGNTVYVLKSHLKVMLEEDYLAIQKSEVRKQKTEKDNNLTSDLGSLTSTLSSNVIREIILPEIEKEVNEGKNFAMLRQIYSGMVLATWYKKALKESLLGKIYADKAKVKGVDQNPKANESIYQKYLAAFKKGVYNYIKEDFDKYTNQAIPHKYFAGGFIRDEAMTVLTPSHIRRTPEIDSLQDAAMQSAKDLDYVSTALGENFGTPDKNDQAMLTKEELAYYGLSQQPVLAPSAQFNKHKALLLKFNFGQVNIYWNGWIYVWGQWIPFNQRSEEMNEIIRKINGVYERLTQVEEHDPVLQFWTIAKAKFDSAVRFGFNVPKDLPRVLRNKEVTLFDSKDTSATSMNIKTRLSGIFVPLRRGLFINEQGKFVVARKEQDHLNIHYLDQKEISSSVRSAVLIYIARASAFDQRLQRNFKPIWEAWAPFYTFNDIEHAYPVLLGLYKAITSQIPKGNFKVVVTVPNRPRTIFNIDAKLAKIELASGLSWQFNSHMLAEGVGNILYNPQASFHLSVFPEETGLTIKMDIIESNGGHDRAAVSDDGEINEQVEAIILEIYSVISGSMNHPAVTVKLIQSTINVLKQQIKNAEHLMASVKRDRLGYAKALVKFLGAVHLSDGVVETFVEIVDKYEVQGIVRQWMEDVAVDFLVTKVSHLLNEDVILLSQEEIDLLERELQSIEGRFDQEKYQMTEKVIRREEKNKNIDSQFQYVEAVLQWVNSLRAQENIEKATEKLLDIMDDHGSEIFKDDSFVFLSGHIEDISKQAEAKQMEGWSYKWERLRGAEEGWEFLIIFEHNIRPYNGDMTILPASPRPKDFFVQQIEAQRPDWGQDLKNINPSGFAGLLEEIRPFHGDSVIPPPQDRAQIINDHLGGIDLNSTNLKFQIKRDGKGVPLPLAQQDMAQLGRIQGFEPEIIEIKAVTSLPILGELQQKLQTQQGSDV